MNACIKTPKACLLAVSIAIVGALLCLTPVGFYLEEEFGYWWLFQLRGPQPAPQEVVIVSIDKPSVDMMQWTDDPEKWPRSYHARLIQQLNQYHPAIIAFNIVFDESRDAESDQLLAAAMAEGKNVILSNYLKHNTTPPAAPYTESSYESIIDPIPLLDDAALATAPFLLPKSLSTVKQFWAFRGSAGDIPTFPVAVFECYVLKTLYSEILQLLTRSNPEFGSALPQRFEQFGRDELEGALQGIRRELEAVKQSGEQWRQALAALHLTPAKAQLLRSWMDLSLSNESLYFNHYGGIGTVTTIPLYQVLSGKSLRPEVFNGKVVLIGYSENIQPEKNRGFYTVYSTVDGETTSAIEIAATAVANLIDDSWLRPLPLLQQLLLLLAWAILLSSFCRFCSYNLAALLIGAAVLVYHLVAYVLFAKFHVWLPLFIPIVIQAFLVLFAASIASFITHKEERGNLYNAARAYLPDNIVDSMLEQRPSSQSLRAVGELKQGVCMASDAEQYTALSEMLDPAALNELMNNYYAAMFPVVKKHRGLVTDVIGDAMLAVWASYGPDVQMRVAACQAALEINAAATEFNRTQTRQLPTRLGLHYGDMRLGNVGAPGHYEYRAVGDVVNTATRIENLNKFLGTQILVSAPVIDGLPQFAARQVGVFILKGKKQPVIIHELLPPSVREESSLQLLLHKYAEALSLFQSYLWPQALEAFQALAQEYPHDGPTLFYIIYLKTNLSFIPETEGRRQPACIDMGNITTLLRS